MCRMKYVRLRRVCACFSMRYEGGQAYRAGSERLSDASSVSPEWYNSPKVLLCKVLLVNVDLGGNLRFHAV